MGQEINRQLFIQAGPIATLTGGNSVNIGPLCGTYSTEPSLVVTQPPSGHPSGHGFLVEDGMVVKIAPTVEFKAEWLGSSVFENSINLDFKAIIPGFVDSHTHLLWAGDRSNEMRMRQRGMTYAEIADAGGGIRYTVQETRNHQDFDKIVESRVKTAISLGTTALEVKSGYGLNTETELRMLEAYSRMQEKYPDITFHITWMGAHDIPTGQSRKEYIDTILSDQLPAVLEQGYADSVDVFCEPGWFTIEDTEEICRAAVEGGLGVRLHVDEFVDGGGLDLSSELGARTADHAIHSDEDARHKSHLNGTLQGFLPGTPYVLGNDHWPPAKKCIENKWAWSLASDFNPNCQSLSIPMVGSLATHRMGVDPIDALIAATRNSATTIIAKDAELTEGIFGVGAKANFNVLNSQLIESWCQTPGQSPIAQTYIMGKRY